MMQTCSVRTTASQGYVLLTLSGDVFEVSRSNEN
jgi:hypothetical protein